LSQCRPERAAELIALPRRQDGAAARFSETNWAPQALVALHARARAAG
jgi:hypothetical protein